MISITIASFQEGHAMELRHMRYFVAIVETLNFTRAAQRVHVTNRRYRIKFAS
ncbi:hypothetical protein HORIV_65720 [Vreelandella olivaria]|uniref:HTH lysR-type domain-containing protein n=1 Tax=Vreelandella olivaria TaxID=390919 RepID=A0ABN5XC77_9GAMM|nr:hypothetical protein HORIV_65720 [Halomonas olivaria]